MVLEDALSEVLDGRGPEVLDVPDAPSPSKPDAQRDQHDQDGGESPRESHVESKAVPRIRNYENSPAVKAALEERARREALGELDQWAREQDREMEKWLGCF